MASPDDDRRELYDLLESTLGSRTAVLLMAHLPPIGWSELATRTDLAVTSADMRALRAELAGEMAGLRGEMAELGSELRGEIAELRSDLRGEMAQLRSDLSSDIGEVRSQLPKLYAANIAAMIGVAGLVLAAGALL